MKVLSLLLAAALSTVPVLAQAQEPQPIHDAADKAAAAAGVAEQKADVGRGKLFWPGVALGVAGVTTAVLGSTVFRVKDNSTGNAPPGAYQACLAQKQDPVYATNNCDGLKAKNVKLLWGGVALGAAGVAMMIGSASTSASFGPGVVRIVHRVRF